MFALQTVRQPHQRGGQAQVVQPGGTQGADVFAQLFDDGGELLAQAGQSTCRAMVRVAVAVCGLEGAGHLGELVADTEELLDGAVVQLLR